MVYKKYIKKKGKLYGPYLYHNVKKDGRVTTHYLGRHEDKKNTDVGFGIHLPIKDNSRNIAIAAVFLSLLIVGLVINLMFVLNFNLTGKVSVESFQEVYTPGETINGNLRLVLKHGELFPAQTQLVIDNAGDLKTFDLKEIVDLQTVIGNFFVENKEIAGEGEGYGVAGEKKVYPFVKFSYKIIDGNEVSAGLGETTNNFDNSSENNETNVSDEGEIIIDAPINNEENSAVSSVDSSDSSQSEDVVQDNSEVVVSQDSSSVNSDSSSDSTSGTLSEGGLDSSVSSDSSSSESYAPTVTGEVVGEELNLIDVQTSFENSFELEVLDGQNIEIVFEEHPVKLEKNGNKIIVTTDYYEFEKGFGKDYITQENYFVPIDLSQLGIIASEGDFVASFVYNGEEITSTTKKIVFEKTLNESIVNKTNLTVKERVEGIIITKNLKIDPEVKNKLSNQNKVRVIIKTKPGVDSIGEPISGLNDFEVVELDENNLDLIDGLNVEDIVEDKRVDLFITETENIIRSASVRNDFGLNGQSKKICLIDTGVDSSVVTNFVEGYDFVNNDTDPSEDQGHGTQVGYIVQSIAAGSQIYVAKVIDENGVGYESDILEGLQYCIDKNVDIISFSIGAGSYSGFCDSNFVADLANTAVDSGIFVAASTGNDGSTSIASPACASKVTSVSSTDKQDNIASFSNVDLYTDVFSPGVGIQTKNIGGVSKTISGTSASAPMVSAAAAIILQNENLNPLELTNRLKTTGKPILFSNIDISRIDVYNAVLNNVTMIPYNFTGNQTEQNLTNETFGLFNAFYRVTPASDVRADGGCSLVGNISIIEDVVTGATIQMRACRGNSSTSVCDLSGSNLCDMKVCNSANLTDCQIYNETVTYTSYSTTASRNVNTTVRSSIYNYSLYICDSYPNACYADWIEIAVNGTGDFFDVFLNSPGNNYVRNYGNISFTCNASSFYSLSNISLWGNWSGGWHLNQTVSVSGAQATVNFNINNTAQGNYKWNCEAVDINNNRQMANSNYSFSIDPCLPPTNEDWNITQSCTVTNLQLTLARDKNLNVLAGGSLKFINTSLDLNLSSNGTSRIKVYSGATMNITSNSLIESLSSALRYGFTTESGSIFSISDSTFKHIGWSGNVGERGLEINGSNSRITGSTFDRNQYSIVLLSGANNSLIDNSSITNSETGVHLEFSNNTNISNNNIKYYNRGIFIQEATNVSIFNNNFSYGQDGISIYGGFISSGIFNVRNLNLTNNLISNHSNSGVSSYSLGSGPINSLFGGNIIYNNTNAIKWDNDAINVTYKDNILLNNSGSDFVISGNNHTAINTTFNQNAVSVLSGYLTVKWYFDYSVTNGVNPLNNATVLGANSTGIVFSVITNSSGTNATQILTEYLRNTTGRYNSTPYTINASWTAPYGVTYKNSSQLNITKSTFLNITLNPCDFSGLSVVNLTSDLSCYNKIIYFDPGSYLNITNAAFVLDNTSASFYKVYIAPSGKFIVKNSKNTIWQNDNLTIDGLYVLQNSTLRFNGTTANGSIGAAVNGTANFTSNETGVIANGLYSGYRYFFIVRSGSNFSMANTTLMNAGWSSIAGQRGLEISTTVYQFKNNNLTNNYDGLVLISSGNLLENITSNYNDAYGLFFSLSSNNNLSNFSSSYNQIGGIFSATSSDNNTISNSTFNYNSQYGIQMSSLNTKIINSYFEGNKVGGVRLNANNSVINNNIFVNTSFSNGAAIYASASNASIFNNLINLSNGLSGIYLYRLNNSVFIQNNTIINSLSGVAIKESSHNILKNISIYNSTVSTSEAVRFSNPDSPQTAYSFNNSFIGFNITNVGNAFSVYAQNLSIDNENKIIDSKVINSSTSVVRFLDNGGLKNASITFVNTTFNKSQPTSFGVYCNSPVQCEFRVRWYLDVNVKNNKSQPLILSTVNAYNNVNSLVFSQLTFANGSIPPQILTEFVDTKTAKIYSTNYTVNVSKAGYLNYSTQLNITSSAILDIFLSKSPIPSSVSLISPTNNYLDYTGNVSFVCNATDSDGLSNITLLSSMNVSEYSYRDDMIVWYHFNNDGAYGENPSLIADHSGYGNNITGIFGGGNAPIPVSNGKLFGGYKFSGFSGAYMNIPVNNVTNISLRDAITVSLWVNISSTSITQSLIGQSSNKFTFFYTPTNQLVLWLYTNQGSDSWGPAGSVNLGTLGINVLNQWHHFVFSHDTNLNRTKIYVDGVRYVNNVNVKTGAFNKTGSGSNFPIGWENINYLNGTIDELSIFSSELSESQVKQLYLGKTKINTVSGTNNSTTFNLFDILDGTYDWMCEASNIYGYVNASNEYRNFSVNHQDIPVVTNVVLSSISGNNYSNDNLTATFNVVDLDNDPITNITDWRVNNSSIFVLNFPFDLNTTSNVANIIRDYSTFQNNGTLGGGNVSRVPKRSIGKVGGSYNFDGVDDHVFVNSNFSLNLINQITIEAWINASSVFSSHQTIVSRGNITASEFPNYWLYLDQTTGKISFVRSYSGNGVQSTNSVNYNQFNHIVVIDNSTHFLLYINGVLDNTAIKTFSANAYSDSLYVGSVFDGVASRLNYFFNGTIDELKVYNRSLTSQQIKSNYDYGVVGRSIEKITASETSKNETWEVAVTPNDGFSDGITVLSNNLTVINSLPIVTLISPNNFNVSTNRAPNFVWNAIDADGDTLTSQFRIILNSSNPGIACSDFRTNVNTASNSYFIDPPLKCFIDDGYYYNWSVRVSDDGGSTWSNWTNSWRLEVQSLVSISLFNASANFGSLIPGDNNDTLDNSPQPFVIENNGNVFVNISLNATDLFITKLNPSDYFKFRVDNFTGEEGSFNYTLSNIFWTNVTNLSNIIAFLNWNNSIDTAKINLNVTAPPIEPPGVRTSILTFTAKLTPDYNGGEGDLP